MLAAAGQGDLRELEKGEEAQFEDYAKGRREALEKTRRGYTQQLVDFQLERARAVAGTGAKRRVVEVRTGLEQVAIAAEDSGLDDFFGDEEGKEKRAGRKKVKDMPVSKRRVNPAIMVDEDIDDDEDMLGHYRR